MAKRERSPLGVKSIWSSGGDLCPAKVVVYYLGNSRAYGQCFVAEFPGSPRVHCSRFATHIGCHDAVQSYPE